MTQRAGYGNYIPASYQVLGPERDSALEAILVTAPASATTVHPTVRFNVRTPNVRCRTRVSLLLESAAANADPEINENTIILAGTGTLWVAEKERSRSGLKPRPVCNVVATGDAPLAVPTDTRLWGYSFEAETNGGELFGQFVPPDIGSSPVGAAVWRIVVRYESIDRLSDEEWNQFKGQYGLRVEPPNGVTLS